MRKLISLISPSILAMLLAWPAQASMDPPAQSQPRHGEPAHVQHERVRIQNRTVQDQIRLRRQRAEAVRDRDEDQRSKSVESSGDEAIDR